MDNGNLQSDKKWDKELKSFGEKNNYFSKKISDNWGCYFVR